VPDRERHLSLTAACLCFAMRLFPRFPFRVPAYYALILRSLTVLEGLALTADPK
jgi:hypothetical protein